MLTETKLVSEAGYRDMSSQKTEWDRDTGPLGRTMM